MLSFSEELKSDARHEIDRLVAQGYSVRILSGDTTGRVLETASRLGLDPALVIGGLSPEAKAARVRELDENDTLMVGDGLNDSPSFDVAWAAATPAVDRAVLSQKSDFYYLGDGVAAVRRTLQAAHRLRRVQRDNLIFAATYNLVAVGLCLAGVVNPVVAAVLMPISSVTVVAITTTRLGRRGAAWMS
jgi:Cu2+-exporting ATPase